MRNFIQINSVLQRTQCFDSLCSYTRILVLFYFLIGEVDQFQLRGRSSAELTGIVQLCDYDNLSVSH